jgi:bloom syndrome protein
MDIQDVPWVIQFMVLPSLSVWMQCLGCAGRSGEPTVAILLVEPSVYKLRKSKGVAGPEDPDGEDKDNEDEDQEDGESDLGVVRSANPTYQKKVEEAMQRWIEAPKCCRIIADAYFHNPPHTTGDSFLVLILYHLMIFRINCPLL